ncbi:acyloxyacyl hydrolase [Variovorax paradoxus]|uniref:acyloxyacyl hydrolase n=1 Tax=Variovorax paradoxus TaxID=34073 RepID=UPI003F513615
MRPRPSLESTVFPLAFRAWSTAVFSLALCSTYVAQAQTSWITPDAIYTQGGAGTEVRSLGIGITWDVPWQRSTSWGLLTSHLDFSLGGWRTTGVDTFNGRRTVTQIGLTPVFRLWLQDSSKYFLEAGIGTNIISPHYQNREKRFSTSFNFGDHIAIGLRFGPNGRDELTLRLQHFSNAGIKHPNPGENFIQVRYLRRL